MVPKLVTVLCATVLSYYVIAEESFSSGSDVSNISNTPPVIYNSDAFLKKVSGLSIGESNISPNKTLVNELPSSTNTTGTLLMKENIFNGTTNLNSYTVTSETENVDENSRFEDRSFDLLSIIRQGANYFNEETDKSFTDTNGGKTNVYNYSGISATFPASSATDKNPGTSFLTDDEYIKEDTDGQVTAASARSFPYYRNSDRNYYVSNSNGNTVISTKSTFEKSHNEENLFSDTIAVALDNSSSEVLRDFTTHSFEEETTTLEPTDYNIEEEIIKYGEEVFGKGDFLGIFIDNFVTGLVESAECRNHTLFYLNHLRNLTMWAVKMLDSTAKLPDGILEGNIRHLGNFDECLSIRARMDENIISEYEDEVFRGKYCLANLHFAVKESIHQETLEHFLHMMTGGRKSLEITRNRKGNFLPYFALFEWAMCVPSSCTSNDLQTALNRLFNMFIGPRGLEIDVWVDEKSCYVDEPFSFKAGDFIMVVVILIFLMAVGAGSAYDLFYRERIIGDGNKEGVLGETLVAFSIPGNVKKLISTSAPSGAFHCLDGIRLLTMLWVIFTHEVFSMSREPWINKRFLLETAEAFWKMPLQNSMLNVDTFFVIGGMLRAYNGLNDLEQKKFQYLTGFVQRYLRITPAYGIAVGFYATILMYMGSGPTWNMNIGLNSERCQQNWFLNMLYVNNYIKGHDMCMPHTWYLAADMQMFLLAPLIIYPMWKFKNFGKWLLALLSFISISVLFVIILVNRYLGVQSAGFHDTMLQEYTTGVYLPTHMRTTSYIVGLGLGYVFFHLKDRKEFKIPKFWLVTGWVLCLLTLFGVVFGPYELMLPGSSYALWDQTFYGSLHRFAWALAVAWIIFVCHKGYGGIINDGLSLSLLRPLSRLTYCAYLVHFAVIMVGTSKLRTALYMDDYFMVHSFLADTAISLVISAVLFLCVEQPFLAVTKMIFRKAK